MTYTGSYDLDVFILDDCDRNSCLVNGDLSAETAVTAGIKYYIVVDGDNVGDEGSYDLELTCYVPATNTPTVTLTPTPTGTWYSSTPTLTPTPTTPCDGVPDLLCDNTISGDSTDGTTYFNFYDCIFGIFNGPEDIYRFQPPIDTVFTARLTAADPPELDLLILEGCDPNNCLLYDDTEINITLTGGVTYYVVVDHFGFGGTGGTYTLQTECNDLVIPLDNTKLILFLSIVLAIPIISLRKCMLR